MATLRIELKNSKPVELVDFTKSLLAINELYDDFAEKRGLHGARGTTKLYVSKLESESIVADLAEFANQAELFGRYVELIPVFYNNLHDIIQYFLGFPRISETGDDQTPSKKQAGLVHDILEPVAKDGASQIVFNVSGDMKVYDSFNYNSIDANAIQNAIRRYVGPQPPLSGVFRDEVLYLFQVRDDLKAPTGDKGIIERFSNRPVKLQFSSEEVKRAITDASENPFRVAFIVDGDVSTVEGKPALYRIHTVRETI